MVLNRLVPKWERSTQGSVCSPCRKYQHVLCKLCYVDSDSTTELRKTILKSVLVAKDSLVYSGGQQPGEKANSYPSNNSKDSAQPWKFLKEESFREVTRAFIILHCVQAPFWLVGGELTGWYFWNLGLSLKLSSSTWVGALIPTEERQDILVYFTWGGSRTLPHGCTIVSWLLLFISVFPPFVVVQSLNRVRLIVTPWTTARQAPLSFTISWNLLRFAQIHVHWFVMLSNHHILCHSLLLPLIFLSIRIFSNELALCIRWPKYWSFSFSTSPSNENSGLISFQIDWFDLLVVQGTLKSVFQHHNSKASVLCC